MDKHMHSIDLPNRVFAYREYGDPDGIPLLYFHSYPSSGSEAAYIDDVARELGLRLIAPDRPGLGGSSMSPNRSISQWPHDVGTLINRLGITEFGVLGLGGGAPYAWVCGAAMSKRVTALGVVSGMTPGISHLVSTAKAFFKLGMLPFTKGRSLDAQRAEKAWQSTFDKASTRERAAALDPTFRTAMLNATADALREGTGGLAKDWALVDGKQWGFAMTNVTVDSIYVWHGDADTRVSTGQMRRHMELLPQAQVTVYPEEGHYSTWVNHHREILTTLRDAMRGEA